MKNDLQQLQLDNVVAVVVYMYIRFFFSSFAVSNNFAIFAAKIVLYICIIVSISSCPIGLL